MIDLDAGHCGLSRKAKEALSGTGLPVTSSSIESGLPGEMSTGPAAVHMVALVPESVHERAVLTPPTFKEMVWPPVDGEVKSSTTRSRAFKF